MEAIIIYGAGGLGALVQDVLQQAGRYQPVAFLDSNPAKHRQIIGGLSVRGGIEQIPALRRAGAGAAIVAIGDNITRAAVAETLATHGLRLVSAIHPLASLSPSAEIGDHVIIGPRATVCVHTRIGAHTVVSAGAIADHDNVIGRGVFLHPAVKLAGAVMVEDFAEIGIGATVIPGRRVGRGACVEPGAVVIHDVAPNTTVGGIPAVLKAARRSGFIPDPESVAFAAQADWRRTVMSKPRTILL
jgi:sugar O-acyltransferase (sialic acid O-acetyltransferase NeuD family)